jgi:hypothetical protein
MAGTRFWKRRFGLRDLGPRHLLVIIAVLSVALIAVLLGPIIRPLFQTIYLRDIELRNDVCIKERLNALGGLDVAGPILLGRFKEGSTAFGDEAAYLENVGRLAAAHSLGAEGPRYVLHTAFWPGSAASDTLAFAALCERSGAEACRIREFRLRSNVDPSQAALIAFENTIRAQTRLRECHLNPL